MPKAKLLSESDADKILNRDIANIILKANARKVLTSRERTLISQFATEPTTQQPKEWVKSYEELGAIFGFSRVSFSRFKKDHKDTPKARSNGLHNVEDWRKFFDAHPTIQAKSDTDEPTITGKSTLEIERLKQQCRRLVFDNDEREGLYLLRSAEEAWLLTQIEAVKQTLELKFRNELPPKLVGLGAAEIADELDKLIQPICDALRRPTVSPGARPGIPHGPP